MNPMLAGLILQGLTGMWGAQNQNSVNKQNARFMQQNRDMFGGYLQNGPSDVENQLMKLITQGPQAIGSGFNTGQDALMQMLNRGPIDTQSLFDSWKPMEQDTLDTALSDFWGTTSGLGQRFGSAAAKETGKIRGQAANQAAARREETSVDLSKFNQGQQSTAAQALMQFALQGMAQQMGGFGTLLGAQNNRNQMNMGIMQAMAGMSPMAQPNAIPGAMGDFSQLLMMLPMLQQLMGGKAGAKPATGGWTPAAAGRAGQGIGWIPGAF